MRIFRPAALAATLAMLAGPAAAATTFDFFWTGDSSVDLTVMSTDSTAAASGTFVIDAGPGDEVGLLNVLSYSVTFGTVGASSSEITRANAAFLIFDGTVSADGTSIAMRNFFVSEFVGTQEFGCIMTVNNLCDESSQPGQISLRLDGAPPDYFAYATADDARASLRFTAQQQVEVIPLPAALPLLLGALGLLAVMRRRGA